MLKKALFTIFLIIASFITHSVNASDCFQQDTNTIYTNATVFLEINDGSDNIIIGSGFVGPDHLIYTANHLIPKDYESITVINHNHTIIGYARVDTTYNQEESAKNFFEQDVKRLRINKFNKESPSFSEAAFNSIQPLDIETQTSTQIASITTPFGVSGGASGAPVINNLGHVIGIVSAATVPEDHGSTDINLNHYNSIIDIGDNTTSNNYIKLPNISHVYIAPIKQGNINATTSTSITIPAYPQARCIVYTGTITQSMQNTPVTILAKNP